MGQESSNRIVIRSEDLVHVRDQNENCVKPALVASNASKSEPQHLSHHRPTLKIVMYAAGVVAGVLIVGAIVWQVALGRTSVTPADSPEKAHGKAIERVLIADHRIGSETVKAQPAKAPPSQFADAIRNYCARAAAQSFSDCPPEFVLAYRQHLRAWRDEGEAIANLPDSFLEGVFLATVNTFLRGELDGGERRLTSEVRNAVQRVRSTWEEVERIAAKYSVVAPE